MIKTTLNPNVLKWARLRAGFDAGTLAKKVLGANGTKETVDEWERTGELPIRLAEVIAEKTHTAFGFLFLDAPPKLELPIRDFRTLKSISLTNPSADLLDVLHKAQLRQNWYREFLISNGESPLPFVGDASIDDPPEKTASNIRRTIGIGPSLTAGANKWESAFRDTIEAVESAGVLFLRAGYAGGYTARKLSVEEFRGFAICDEYAPLVFINGADYPNAQMFTLAHELVHIWLGESGVSNLKRTYSTGGKIESYCNEVAAEILLPMEDLKASWRTEYGDDEQIYRLSKKYKISTVVVARRAHDGGFIGREKYNAVFRRESGRKRQSSGGQYYLNEQYQNSKRFSVAILNDAKEGRTLFHDAMKLLGIKKQETFSKYMQSLKMEAA